MAAALDNPSSAELTDVGVIDEKRRRRRFLWLFLLLPLGGAGYYILHTAGHGAGGHSGIGGGGSGSVVERTVTPGKTAEPVAPGMGAGAPGEGSGTLGERSGASGDRSGTSGERSGASGERSGNLGKRAGTSGERSGTSGERSGASGERSGASGERSGASGERSVTLGKGAGTLGKRSGTPGMEEGRGGVREGSGSLGERSGSVKGGSGAAGDGGKNLRGRRTAAGDGSMTDMDNVVVNGKRKKGVKGGEAGNGRNSGSDAGRVAGYPVDRVGMRGDYRLTVNVEAPMVTKDSSKAKPKASRKQKSSFLYAGLMAAPDFSTVKFQSTKGVGTTFSLLVGYQFNKKWAVETGVSLDRKRYYTDAEYFDKKGLSALPTAWDVTNMDGTCYMWEVPVNVRYNFSQGDKTSWFATAGLSTYFMTRENYTYQYLVGGWGPYNSKPWEVKKPSNYLFSIINLSAGYEHRIGNIGNLRIEPYLRIPMSGLGTGKLNILSGGLNIGITRRLW